MSRRRKGILTGGTWCVDYNCSLSHWPEEEGLAELFEEERHGGGSSCNLALAIKRLDPEFAIETIGLVGEDDNGRYLLELAAEAGIDLRQITVTSAAATHFCHAYVSHKSRRRTHIFHAGVGALLTPDHFDFSQTSMRYFHLGLPGVHRLLDSPWQNEPNGWVAILKKARAAGLQTNLELASIEKNQIAALTSFCLPHLDFLIVNDFEIGAIGSVETIVAGKTDAAACHRAARAALERGAMQLVVVHCPAFALITCRDGQSLTMPSVAVPESAILGSNGAGDAFAAGMLYGLHQGWELEACLQLAHAVGAVSLRAISSTGGLLPWRQCLDLTQTWGKNPPPGT